MSASALPPPLPVAKRPFFGFWLFLILAVLLLTLVAWIARTVLSPVVDEPAMLQAFSEYRSSFQRLRTMASEDAGLIRITLDAVVMSDYAKVPLSPARIAEYRELLRRVGGRDGLRKDSNEVWITRSRSGLAVSYSTTGWVFMADPPGGWGEHVVASFSQMPKHPGDSTYFRPIEGGWYLYRESD